MRLTEEQYADLLKKRGAPSGKPNTADTSNPPFAPIDMMLDLPPPLSVNSTRRVDWKTMRRFNSWKEMADKFLDVAVQRGEVRIAKLERYELHVTLSEDHCKSDADNGLKLLIDYLRDREITVDDAKKNLRKITVEWGHAPAGCRVLIRPLPNPVNAVLQRAAERMEAGQ